MKLTAENERLRALSGKSSGNSSLPSSRDTAAERARQAKERKAENRSLPHHATGGPRRPASRKELWGTARRCRPLLAPGRASPALCSSCGAGLHDVAGEVAERRQVIDLCEPSTGRNQSINGLSCRCDCGATTSGRFRSGRRAGSRWRAERGTSRRRLSRWPATTSRSPECRKRCESCTASTCPRGRSTTCTATRAANSRRSSPR